MNDLPRNLLMACAVCLVACLGIGLGYLSLASSATATPPSSRPTSKPPSSSPWWKRAVFYEVFVRSFQDSDGDGVGDIKGLIQRLDYLNDGNPKTSTDLGVTALWLMPIFRSGSYHGYDTEDYRAIDPRYGTHADFKRLLKESHRRGIRVIVDYVINHTSRAHPWFKASASSASSPYRSWYVWRKDNPKWTQPWGSGPVWHSSGDSFFYGIFWSGMPDLNFRHPPVRKEMTRIARYWLRQGVDGFRLDAARYLFADGGGALQSDRPRTHHFWKSFRKDVKATSPNALMVGEIWTQVANIAPYCQGDEMDMAFHFGLAGALKGAATSMTTDGLWRVLSNPTFPSSCWATFLTNHDQERIMSQLHSNMPMMKTAAALLLTLPGTPFLYYGEEIGMLNGPKRDDRHKRMPMAWDGSPQAGFTKGTPWFQRMPHKQANVAVQTKKAGSLLSWYRRLIHLRQKHPALSEGSLTRVSVRGQGSEGVMAFVREHKGKRLLVLLNLEDQSTANVHITLPFATRRWKTWLREGTVHVTHRGTARAPHESPYTLATKQHKVKLGPTSMWVVGL